MAVDIEIKNFICSNCGEMTNFPIYDKKNVGIGFFLWFLFWGIVDICLGLLFMFTNDVFGQNIQAGTFLFWFGISFFSLAFFGLWIANVVKSSSSGNVYCPHCNGKNVLMSTDSPKGKELFNKYYC